MQGACIFGYWSQIDYPYDIIYNILVMDSCYPFEKLVEKNLQVDLELLVIGLDLFPLLNIDANKQTVYGSMEKCKEQNVGGTLKDEGPNG